MANVLYDSKHRKNKELWKFKAKGCLILKKRNDTE